MESARYSITGISPLLLHSGQAIDPLNQYAKEMKRLSKKKTKTDEDHAAISRCEWFMSVYHDGNEDVVKDGEITVDKNAVLVLPAMSLEACLIAGAKKSKRGGVAKAGLIIEADAPIQHDGPASIVAMHATGRYTHRVAVRVGTARVMRTRPILRVWSALVEIGYDSSVIDQSEILEIFKAAGQLVGIGDWRPKFGRFEVTAA